MAVRVQTEDFDVARELARSAAATARVGAVAAFIGTVRDVNDDARVASMTLEHYPGMTEKVARGDRRRGEVALGHHRRARDPSRRRACAHRPDRAGRRDERASRRGVRRLRIHHRLPEDPRAVLEEGDRPPTGARWVEARASERRRSGGAADRRVIPRRESIRPGCTARRDRMPPLRSARDRLGNDVGACVSPRRRAANILDETSAPLGIQHVRDRRVRRRARRAARRLGATSALPRIACGMIGSRQGWVEAPVRRLPGDRSTTLAPIVWRDRRAASSRSCPAFAVATREGIPDVMRGEETADRWAQRTTMRPRRSSCCRARTASGRSSTRRTASRPSRRS